MKHPAVLARATPAALGAFAALVSFAAALFVAGAAAMDSARAQDVLTLEQAVQNKDRSARNKARDTFRHPLEVLRFMGVKPTSHIVEILPGSGAYYREILAPFVKAQGKFYAANRDSEAPPRYLKDHQRMLAKLKANPAMFGKVAVTKFNPGKHPIAPAGSADFVLTFRNLHNWLDRKQIDAALKDFHKALKPGGVLGVVDHRGRNDLPQEKQIKTGYVRQDYAIRLIEKAGFRFAGASEANANSKDTKDYPKGVWTLPPSLRLKEKDRAKYLAIGESDRFTLKFIKK
ncbi:MAG: class I SAM-dependent methyltransferase [Hyphomicrobiales bacterium]|nr:class I SAM-dependent methyltransferase [Hyphomicrobiales bacterium]